MTFLVAGLLLASCGDRRLTEVELSGPVMGTSYSIKLIDPPRELDRERLGAIIVERLADIEQRFSTYRPSSELSMINGKLTTEWIPVSGEMCNAIATSIGLSRRSNGAFDITVGPLVLLWGFGPDGDRSAPPADELVAEARSSVGYEKLEADCSILAIRKALPGVYLDLSAFVKGYAVDEIASILDAALLTDYLVEIGGELCAAGLNAHGEPWAIAIEVPDVTRRAVQTIVNVTDRCMATSGDYRNFFTFDGIRYSHAVDPATGRPVTHDTASVTVLASSAAEADGLATGLLVRGADQGLEFAEIAGIDAYFLVRADGDFEQKMSGNFGALQR